jgi:glutamine cyclotransferase
MKIYSFAFLFILGSLTWGGCDSKRSGQRTTQRQAQKVTRITEMELPPRNASFTIGDQVPVYVAGPDTLEIDSLQLFFRGQQVGTFLEADTLFVSTANMLPGMGGVRVKVFFDGGKDETHSRQVELVSDIVPARYTYKVINTYPHDVGAYTQGLIYYDGWLYEGTGNYNQSTVRKVRLGNGEVIQSRNNASDIFGEGITIYNGRIYQLSYKAQICFVYDLNTLEEVQKYYYQNKEGWGLTNNADELIMSDGTNILYFLDPEMFTVNRQIEVYNNEGPVKDLNELEYIDGKIYSNRYYTDEIVIIDPFTGKEEGRVDMKGILSIKDRKPSTNVLNGIAWDAENERLFITGKYWPKLFEIELVPVAE